jgi:two-component system, NarL family, invasion response regulator UvrY
VLIVDDHDFFLGVLREVIEATPGMTVVGEASSGEDAVEAVEALSPRMVVMDKRMRGIGGIEAARRIGARHPHIVVVLVSVEAPQDGALQASGAAAFLHKRTVSPRALSEVWSAHGR